MTLRTGGLERLLVDFGKHADAQRFHPRFVALGELGPPAEDLRALGFTVDSAEIAARGKLRTVMYLRDMFLAEQIQIVHTHNTYAHFYGTLAARLAGVKTVINTQHGRGCGAGWRDRWQFRIANLFTRRVVGVSRDAEALCRSQNPWSAARMTHIWNGIDVERFAYTGPATAPVAISVARLSPEKDYGTLLRAVALVRQEVADFKLRLVGDGVERAGLERLARELQLQDGVEFLGERKDVPQLLATAGFFVSSSKTEGISLTLLEAMAVGLPIVTTAVGGNPEIVVEGETGLLVPSQSPAALAGAMKQMLDRREQWPAIARRARSRVEQHFEIRQMIRAYESMYDEN